MWLKRGTWSLYWKSNWQGILSLCQLHVGSQPYFLSASIILFWNILVVTLILSFALVSVQAAFVPVLSVLFVSKALEGSGSSSASLVALLSPGTQSSPHWEESLQERMDRYARTHPTRWQRDPLSHLSFPQNSTSSLIFLNRWDTWARRGWVTRSRLHMVEQGQRDRFWLLHWTFKIKGSDNKCPWFGERHKQASKQLSPVWSCLLSGVQTTTQI